MKVVLSTKEIFTPIWNGNQEEENPITVEYEYLTVEERNEYFIKMANIKSYADITKEIFLKKVKKINGLELEIDGKVQIVTPELVLKTPGKLFELFQEITAHIIETSAIGEEDKKK